MDHAGILQKLSAYLDGVVTPREKALIEEHLQTCEECRTALSELERTVSRLRDLGDVEPPPWLTQRVMARVREEAAQEKGWLRRLFVPLRWKLPMEVAALVFLTVTSYLVYKEVSPELDLEVARTRVAPVSPAPPPASVRKQEKPMGEVSRPAKKEAPAGVPGERFHGPGKEEPAATIGGKAGQKRETGAPEPMPSAPVARSATGSLQKGAPVPSPMEDRAPVFKEEQAQPQGFTADQDYRVEKKMKRAIPKRMQEGAGYAPPPPSAAKDSESAAPALRSKSIAPAGTGQLRLVIKVADRASAVREVERLAELSSAKLVRKGSRGGKGSVVVRLDRKDLQEFLDRLDWIGEVHGKSAVSSLELGVVEVAIDVTAEP